MKELKEDTKKKDEPVSELSPAKKGKRANYASMTVLELEQELQKKVLQAKSGEEQNTSVLKLIKKEIARKRSKLSSSI